MKIIVFGATGMVGKELVRQALLDGHAVKAYGRNVFVEALPENKSLELVHGALFDESQVLHAIKGCDAVLSALGGAIDGTDKTRSLGMKIITQQMKKAGVKRIIAIGGTGLLNAPASAEAETEDSPELLMNTTQFPPEYMTVTLEHLKALQYLQESALDWTMVCPPIITNEAPTGLFTTNANYLPEANNNSITAGDLALFMLSQLNNCEYLHCRVGISN